MSAKDWASKLRRLIPRKGSEVSAEDKAFGMLFFADQRVVAIAEKDVVEPLEIIVEVLRCWIVSGKQL